MKKSNKRLIDILIVVFISCFIGMLGGAMALYTIDYKNDKGNELDISKYEEIDKMFDTIVEEYYDDVDKKKLIEGAISGMLSVLDTHTSYMDKTNTDNFSKKMLGEYYGIGIEALTLENTGILVVSVMDGSPAHRSGILEGDIIIKANNESLKDKDAAYFTSIVSKSEDEIKLVISRSERELNISVKPEKVVIKSVISNQFVVNNKKVGYIKMTVFAANTASQFATELKKLEENGIDSLVIDVRDNSGGYLSSVTTILEMFMKEGAVLYNIESKTSTSSKQDSTDEYRDYPVAVLVNGSSASASEILAACFMENVNSEVVGNTTYGKGTVQETVNVFEGSMAKITTKKWLTPNNNWINQKGITPTIVVSVTDTYLQNPIFANDNQLDAAINSLTTK